MEKLKSHPGIAAAVLLLAASITLTACDPGIAGDPLAISTDGENLLVAVCSDMVVTEIVGYYGNRDADHKEKEFWRAAGEIRLGPGDILSPTIVTPGMTPKTVPAATFTPGTRIEVVYNSTVGDVIDSAYGVTTVPSNGLVEGVWMHNDGSETADPCSVE